MTDHLIGATTAVFVIKLSVALTEPVDVAWSTKDGTAKAGIDYQAANGVVTFLPGDTEKQVQVTVYGQPSTGPNKTFYIQLTPPTNAILGNSLVDCIITVVDEDGTAITTVVVAQGKQGLKGDPGVSAYEQAVLMGYEGTVEQWMDDIADASQAAIRAEEAIAEVEANAAKAEAAANAAAFSGRIYPTPSAGVDPVTGVPNGAYFNVRSTSNDNFIDEYRNVGGVATSTGKSYPTSQYVGVVADHSPLPYVTGKSYALYQRVQLNNGDIVKNTVVSNTNDPNSNMTGWVKEPNANNIFRVNGKFVGIVPFLDISSALSGFLNSSDVKEIYLDGEYLLSSQIIVSASAAPKKIFCSDSTILKPMVTGNLPLFDLYSSVEFHNATFDYQNGNCFTTLRYRPNCGLVKLRDIKIKNIKDMVSSYGTIIFSISTEGNKLDIDGVSFENCLKLGNGNITDSAGSLNGVYYFGTTGLIRGEIKNIYAKDYHNINASSQIIIEDTAVVYIATGGIYTPLTVENVIGDEFGKRLVKAQCSGVTFKNIRGTSTTGDSLSVVGILSDVGFTANNNIVSGVYARGNMDYAYADSGVNTQIDNLDIDLYGSNSLNNGSLHFGAYFGASAKKNKLSNSTIKARRPIGINPTLVGDSIEDLNFDNVDLELTDAASVFIDIPGNSSTTNGAIKRLTAKLTLRTSATRTTGAQLINTFNVQKNYSDFDLDVKFIDKSSASNTTKAVIGSFHYIKNLTLRAKFISESGLAPDQIGDLATISNSSNVFVDVESEQKFNRCIIATANTGFKVSKNSRLGACAIGQVVATGTGTKYEVPDNISLYNGLTSVNEVLRGFGPTAQRPVNATIGFSYFDTTLGKVVNLKSSSPNVWVDGAGTVV